MKKQSIKTKHKVLRQEIDKKKNTFKHFKQDMLQKLNTDKKTRHYSVYHNFDAAML